MGPRDVADDAEPEAPVGSARVSIPEPHRWILAAEAGTMERFGIGVGSTLDPEAVRTF